MSVFLGLSLLTCGLSPSLTTQTHTPHPPESPLQNLPTPSRLDSTPLVRGKVRNTSIWEKVGRFGGSKVILVMEHYACLTSSTASTWGVSHILERNHSFLGMFVSVAILSVFHSLIYSFTSSDHVLTSFCEREVKVTRSCPTLWDPSSPGENTGVGSLSHLQGIFSIQGVNPGLPNCRRVLYHLSHKGSPTILEWVAYPFSSGSSQPRNRTRISALQVDSLPTELSG